MSANKRMIYIRPENLEFYNNLKDKSEFVNDAIEAARNGVVDNTKVTQTETTGTDQTQSAQNAVDAMRERDLKVLKEYREKNGIAPPAGV